MPLTFQLQKILVFSKKFEGWLALQESCPAELAMLGRTFLSTLDMLGNA
jgi:hypothetical protein